MFRSRVTISVLLVSSPTSIAGVLPPDTQDLLLDKPGASAAFESERLVALYGVVLDADSSQQTTTTQFVEDESQEFPDLHAAVRAARQAYRTDGSRVRRRRAVGMRRRLPAGPRKGTED